MAVIKCPECGGMVSDTCETCPHCGYRIVEKTEVGKAVFRIARNTGWLGLRFKCDIKDTETGKIINTVLQDDVWSMDITKPLKVSVHIHGIIGTEEVSLKPSDKKEIYVSTYAGFIKVDVTNI